MHLIDWTVVAIYCLASLVLGVILSKGSLIEGLIVGWALTPKGDTELVIATIAYTSKIIDINIYSAIITVALLSTFISPIVFKYLIRKYSSEVKYIQS